MRRLFSLMLLMMVFVVGCKKDDPVITEYIVTFNTQGGSSIDALKVTEGGKATKPQDPTKENYIFSGWYKEAACTTVWNFEKEPVMSNVTLYAKWVAVTQACTVTFDSLGGSEVAPLTVNKGDKLVQPTKPTKENCSFLGWYKDASCTTPWEFSTDVVNENIILYAGWSNPGETVFTVTFDTDGGNEIEPAFVKDNEKVIRPVDPLKLGFDLEAWCSDPERQTVYDFETPVTDDITLYAKWKKAEIAFIDFDAAELASVGIKWDEKTTTLDITTATGSGSLSFNVVGLVNVDKYIQADFDSHAKSIGGKDKLNNILIIGETVGNKIGMTINVPEQSIKVPLDIHVFINELGDIESVQSITITSRPDYAGTGIRPVKMRTTDNQVVFWAPINVGATEIPANVSEGISTPGGTNDITAFCGQLFQWGRKHGFTNTNNSTTTDGETFSDRSNYPKGQRNFVQVDAEGSTWYGKFIVSSDLSPNTQGNWLLFNESGTDNSFGDAMEDGAWYQKLWNNGSEAFPVKTDYDPCPAGWRLPTLSEWKTIGVGNPSVAKEWDSTKKLLSIPGADSDEKLVLPATGHRIGSSGASSHQGNYGYYWSSSIPSKNADAYCVLFNSATLDMNAYHRASGNSVRCIQE